MIGRSVSRCVRLGLLVVLALLAFGAVVGSSDARTTASLPDLAITKTLQNPPPPVQSVGGTYVFLTKVKNVGAALPANTLVITHETIPAGFTVVSVTPQGAFTSNNFNGCSPLNLPGVGCVWVVPAGGFGSGIVKLKWTLKINSVPAGGKFTNCADTYATPPTGLPAIAEQTLSNNTDCVPDIPVNPATAPPVNHFKCYVPGPSPTGPTTPVLTGAYFLQDDFDPSSSSAPVVTIGDLVRFCNPVQKTYAGATATINPVTADIHLAIYGLTQQTAVPSHTIGVTNQLETAKTYHIGPPQWIAVPSLMNSNSTQPDPTLLSHFKCYPVLGFSVDLLDPSFNNHEEPGVTIGAPFMFCNSATKIHSPSNVGPNTTYPNVNPGEHLLCYTFAFNPFPFTLKFTNQFNLDHALKVTGADLLCVPTTLNFVATP